MWTGQKLYQVSDFDCLFETAAVEPEQLQLLLRTQLWGLCFRLAKMITSLSWLAAGGAVSLYKNTEEWRFILFKRVLGVSPGNYFWSGIHSDLILNKNGRPIPTRTRSCSVHWRHLLSNMLIAVGVKAAPGLRCLVYVSFYTPRFRFNTRKS